MSTPVSNESLELMAKYMERLAKLMREYAGKGLEYVQVERATIQALLDLNWEFNVAVSIRPPRDSSHRSSDGRTRD